MDFFEVLKKRRSIRVFQKREVEEEKVRRILECVSGAPSAGNLQGFEVVAIRDPGRLEALARAAKHPEQFVNVPVVLAFVQDQGRSAVRFGDRGKNLYSLQDATIACTIAMLAATALGLSTCWVGAFRDEEVGKLLGVKEGLIPVALLPIGYAAEAPEPKPRRPLEDIVRRETL